MRILHIHPSLGSGGIEAMICGLANRMAGRHDVTVCSIFDTNESQVFLQKMDEKVRIRSLHKHEPGIDFAVLWRIYKFVKGGDYDVVHIHGFFYYYALTILFLHRRCGFFYTIHSDARKENTRWDRRIFPLKKLFFKWGWMIPVTISKASKKSFDELYGMDGDLIYNGVDRPVVRPVDLSDYRCTPRTRILFHPGRISPAKNQEMLCRVCKRLTDEGYDIVLLIAGQIQDQVIFDKISQYFHERIIYLGERNDVTGIMSNADAFCLSSLWEGMPVSLLEAISVGCIPICTPVGGIPELIENDKTGFLAESSGEEDYYEILKKYLSASKATLEKYKTALAMHFDSFEISNTALHYEALYKSYLTRHENLSNHPHL